MYQQIAAYYDLLHSHLVDDIAFLVELAEETGGPILELGCGTGRLLLPLARLGYRVVGVDTSNEMLAIAQEKSALESAAIQERVKLMLGDLGETVLDTRFCLAVIPYNTAMHLSPAALTAGLRNVRRQLKPGGVLFIDVDNPTNVHDSEQDGVLLLERTVTNEAEGEIVMLSVSSVGDGTRQTRDVVWIVDVSAAEGGLVKRLVARSTLHYTFAHQYVEHLEAAGFKLQGMYGDYDRRPYEADDSERLLLLAAA